MDHIGDDAEHFEFLPILQVDGGKVRVGWQQGGARMLLPLLDGELAIEASQHDGTVTRRDGSIHDQQVAIIDACLHHAATTGPYIVGGGRVLDTDLVEVDGLLDVVLRRAWEPAGGWREEQGDLGGWRIGVVADHD